jgi:hypothetical protein
MITINEFIFVLIGFIAGIIVQELFVRNRLKKHLEEQLLPCWTESRIVAIQRVVEALDQGMRHGRWPTLAHFRSDLVGISEDLKKHYKEKK